MNQIDIPLGERSYPVLVGTGLINQPEQWDRWVPDTPIVVFSNDRVAPLYLDRLLHALGEREVYTLVIRDGEAEKSFENYERAMRFLADRGIRRDACLLALGGGVIGDLCGFVAATWMRGVRFIQFPTTLLAQVDASVGGKPAINIPAGKNLVGAFHQPSLVVADIGTLATLDDREYRAGLAEVLKYGAIRDAAFLEQLEARVDALNGRDADALVEGVSASVRHKAEVVAEDELEAGVRATLNFGHTFGHAIEAETDYTRFLHGEAVAIGMVVAARLSEQQGLCPAGVSRRIGHLLQRLGLPVTIPADLATDDLLALMGLDKKNVTGTRRLVLLRDAGDAFIDTDSPDEAVRQAIDDTRQRNTP